MAKGARLYAATPEEIAEELKGRRTIALSPHSDDLALSVGGILSRCAPWPELTVWTLFSRSTWAPRRPDLGEPRQIARVRIREDQEYCHRLGCSLVTMPFPDAGLRGFDARTELTVDLDDDPMADGIVEALRRLLRAVEPEAIWAPLGLGGHVDHRIAALAALTAELPGTRLWFYEDLPYAAEETLGGRPRLAESLPAQHLALIRWRCEIGEKGLQDKLQRLSFYDSQIRAQDRCAVEAHAREAGEAGTPAEFLWRTAGG